MSGKRLFVDAATDTGIGCGWRGHPADLIATGWAGGGVLKLCARHWLEQLDGLIDDGYSITYTPAASEVLTAQAAS